MKLSSYFLPAFCVASVASAATVKTGITWSSEKLDEADLNSDRLNFKPRTSVASLDELGHFLHDQLAKDEMSVVISFFEPEAIKNQAGSYKKYLRAGGIAQNSMVAFALSTSYNTASALRIPAPLPVSVFFSPAACTETSCPQEFEMRRAKFFEDGQVFLDGQLPILAFVTVGKDDQATTAVRFPKTVKEAMGYEEGVQWPEEEVEGGKEDGHDEVAAEPTAEEEKKP